MIAASRRCAGGFALRASIFVVSALLLPCLARAGVLDATWNAPTINGDGSFVSGVASYRVYYGTSNPPCATSSFVVVLSTVSAPATGTVVSATLTGLATGTPYFVQVTALDASGNESPYSNVANAVARPDPTDTTPPMVTITSPVITATY